MRTPIRLFLEAPPARTYTGRNVHAMTMSWAQLVREAEADALARTAERERRFRRELDLIRGRDPQVLAHHLKQGTVSHPPRAPWTSADIERVVAAVRAIQDKHRAAVEGPYAVATRRAYSSYLSLKHDSRNPLRRAFDWTKGGKNEFGRLVGPKQLSESQMREREALVARAAGRLAR